MSKETYIRLKIKSQNDVITNSSDETFIIKSDKRCGVIRQELLKFYEEHRSDDDMWCSGMGGEIEVYDNVRPYEGTGEFDGDVSPMYPELPDGYFACDIDNGLEGLHRFIKENYDYVCSMDDDEYDKLTRPYWENERDRAQKDLENAKTQKEIEESFERLEEAKEMLGETDY